MFPFVKIRKTKSNFSLAKEGGEEAFDEDQYEDEQNNEDENNEDKSNEGYDNEDQYEANELENSLKKSTEEISEKRDTPFLKRKFTRKMEKTKLKVKRREKSEIEEEEFKALQVINELASAEESKGECEIYIYIDVYTFYIYTFYINVEPKLMNELAIESYWAI